MTSLLVVSVLASQAAAPIHGGPITALAFGPDGSLFAAGEGGVVRLAKDGSVSQRYAGDMPKATSLVVGPNGKRIYIAGGTPGFMGRVECFDAASGKSLAKSPDHLDTAMGVSLSPDGLSLATAGADGRVRLYTTAGLQPVASLEGHSGPVYALAFVGDGLLASGGRDASLRVWNTKDQKLLRTLSFHTAPILSISATAPTGGQPGCLTASEDRSVRVWHPSIGRMVRIIRGAEGPVLGVAARATGDLILTADASGEARLVPVEGGDPVKKWSFHGHWATAVAISSDGRTGAIGDSSGRVHFVELP